MPGAQLRARRPGEGWPRKAGDYLYVWAHAHPLALAYCLLLALIDLAMIAAGPKCPTTSSMRRVPTCTTCNAIRWR